MASNAARMSWIAKCSAGQEWQQGVLVCSSYLLQPIAHDKFFANWLKIAER
jgi:hypothetical protein